MRRAPALECTVREETIPRNVASLVKVTAPRYAVNRGLTAPQAQGVLKAARVQRLGALYVLALFLGLRRGELPSLRWEDINLEAGKLEVVQTLQRVGGTTAARAAEDRELAPDRSAATGLCRSTSRAQAFAVP